MFNDDSPRPMLRERLEEAWKAAQEASRAARQTWTRDYNQSIRRNLLLKEGSLVLCKANRRSNTLAQRWTGPARIIKKVGSVVYIVKDLYAERAKEKRVHVNQLMLPYADVDDELGDEPNDPYALALLAAVSSLDGTRTPE